MIKNEEIANPLSCLNKAASDEPIFVLRANDHLAADIVREWARRYAESKITDGVDFEKEKKKYHEALNAADLMDGWRRTRQPPVDLPPGHPKHPDCDCPECWLTS